MEKTQDYNVWIISGEASGDMYGARLVREMKASAAKQGKTIRITGMGGPEMQKTDMEIQVDATELGVVGLIEVFKHIFMFLGIFFGLVRRAVKERPDAVILIDYPGFNLRFAQIMYWYKIPVIWYVTPQVWAWGKHRIPLLAKYCSKMMVIFPFETETYAHTRLGAHTVFTGHPLVDIINEQKDPSPRDPDTFLLLPGSRTHEIEMLLSRMLDTVCVLHKNHPNLKFVLSTPRERIYNKVKKALIDYRAIHPELPEINLTVGDTRLWQQRAGAGLAASGTVTVECAISGLPLVVCYRLNKVTFMFARMLVKLFRGFFTMVNIIADKAVYEEFLQWQVCPRIMVPAIEKILPGGERRAEVIQDIENVKNMLCCGSDNASYNAAKVCMDFISERRQAQQSAK